MSNLPYLSTQLKPVEKKKTGKFLPLRVYVVDLKDLLKRRLLASE